MERLVFNTAEHKMEELEKYGFVKIETYNCFGRLIDNRYMYAYTIQASSFAIVTYSDDNNIYIYAKTSDQELMFSVLYDLIKDGLVVKEKK